MKERHIICEKNCDTLENSTSGPKSRSQHISEYAEAVGKVRVVLTKVTL
jgi:hypothetical protein